MPITELVIPILKPELAKEAQGAIYDGVKGMSGGPIFRSVGHMLRDNGKDVSEEYRAILGLEWESEEQFTTFATPENPTFKEFVGGLVQYVGGHAAPRIFTPAGDSARSGSNFEKGVTQIFAGTASKSEAEGAWKNLEDVLGVKGWSGWGLQHAEGTFVGLIGFEGLEELDAALNKDDVKAAFDKLKSVGATEDYVTKFRV